MSPQEKAAQLILMYMVILVKQDLAKKCALVAVDEIINTLTEMCEETGNDPFESPLNKLDWWKEVKQEIQKL